MIFAFWGIVFVLFLFLREKEKVYEAGWIVKWGGFGKRKHDQNNHVKMLNKKILHRKNLK